MKLSEIKQVSELTTIYIYMHNCLENNSNPLEARKTLKNSLQNS
jgi:hypothetical protein